MDADWSSLLWFMCLMKMITLIMWSCIILLLVVSDIQCMTSRILVIITILTGLQFVSSLRKKCNIWLSLLSLVWLSTRDHQPESNDHICCYTSFISIINHILHLPTGQQFAQNPSSTYTLMQDSDIIRTRKAHLIRCFPSTACIYMT